jgi:hypothetical protein
MNENNDDDEEFPFDGLFGPVQKIFADFDRFFSGLSSVFSIPSQEFNDDTSRPSRSLRDEVLKEDLSSQPARGDENLDSTIERHGFRGAFPSTFSSSAMTTSLQRETTPSGRCIIEKKVQHSSNANETSKTETISKICGEKHHTTIKQDGKIVREYGNASLDELDQIDSSPDDQPTLGGSRHSDFFKRLFS